MPDSPFPDDPAATAAGARPERASTVTESGVLRPRVYRPNPWLGFAVAALACAIGVTAIWAIVVSATARSWLGLVAGVVGAIGVGAYLGTRVRVLRRRGQQTVVGGYRLEAVLGSGSTSTVFLGRDRAGTGVAVKLFYVLGDETRQQRRTRVEGELAAFRAVASAHLPSVVDVIDTAEATAVVMQLVEGATLAAVLARNTRLTAAQSCTVLEGALRGLADLHAAGLVHRDVKPDNVVVTPRGKSWLVDLGLASSAADGTGRPVGSPAYMSPEQSRGEPVDARSDVWSCGAVLFEALDGTRLASVVPSGDDPAAVVTRRLRGSAAVPAVTELTARAVAHAVEDRPADAGEMLAALRERAGRDLGPDWRVGAGLGALSAALGARTAAPSVARVAGSTAATAPAAVGAVAGLLVAALVAGPALAHSSASSVRPVGASSHGPAASATSPTTRPTTGSPVPSIATAVPLDLSALLVKTMLPGAGGGGSQPLDARTLAAAPAGLLHQDVIARDGFVTGRYAFFSGFDRGTATVYLVQLVGAAQASDWMSAARATTASQRFSVSGVPGAVGLTQGSTSWVQFVHGPVVAVVGVTGGNRADLLSLASRQYAAIAAHVPG